MSFGLAFVLAIVLLAVHMSPARHFLEMAAKRIKQLESRV
jgi:hypothetical protein